MRKSILSRHAAHGATVITLSICLLVTLHLSALAQQPEVVPAASSKSTPVAGQMPAVPAGKNKIGPGDVLDVRIFDYPQLSRESAQVDDEGLIAMPLIGEVRAACRTEKELAREIETRYLEYLRNPQVNVFIKDQQSQPVAVIGAVLTPGRFQLRRRMRLLEILPWVNGPSPAAGRSVQIIHTPVTLPSCDSPDAEAFRPLAPEAAEESIAYYNLKDTLRGDDKANPYIQPGDIIILLEAEKVYVVGNVLSPRPIPLTEPITVSRAIAMAGGTAQDSKTSKVRIVRQVDGGAGKEEIFVDLKAIDKNRAEDIALQANDIVEVPKDGVKSFMRSILNAMAPTFGGLPIRVIPIP